MDLLRLTLAHQSPAKLATLTRLDIGAAFLGTAEWTFFRQAEAAIRSQRYDLLLQRAIFLRDAEMYSFFSGLATGAFDFWYAVGSNESRIRGMALKRLLVLSKAEPEMALDIISTLNDPSTIDWNGRWARKLAAIIKGLLKVVKSVPITVAEVVGILLPGSHIGSHEFQMKAEEGRIGRSINWKPEFKSRPDLHVRLGIGSMIRIGYYYPAIKAIEDGIFSLHKVAKWAVEDIAYDLLRYLAENFRMITVIQISQVKERIFTRRDVQNARFCLDDPLVRPLLGSDCADQYAAIAGIVDLDNGRSAAHMSIMIGNPVPFDVIDPGDPDPYFSIQGRVMYNPFWVMRSLKGIDRREHPFCREARSVAAARGFFGA